MNEQDQFRRFFFENLGIRGEIIHLTATFEAVRGTTDYPEPVANLLGQALAAVVLLGGTIKFQGSLILQIQGPGPVTTLVAQTTHQLAVRGLAHWRGIPAGSTLASSFGDGRLILTIQQNGRDPYQGIVALEGCSLAHSLENYFRQSEQLPTRLWLFADGRRAAGMLLQKLPGGESREEDWTRINCLADTLTRQELLSLPDEALLYRLFHEEHVRLLEPEPVVFRCSCSRARIESVLLAMGSGEAGAILDTEGEIAVDCEFCNRHYRFDRVDVSALFRNAPAIKPMSTRH